MTKFSVEIVQQLEFTSPSTNSQISTNVTVKSLNTPKVDIPPSPQSPQRTLSIVECKQEPENIDFVDLEECAAALEKDAAANGGNSFLPGFTDLIGGDAAGSISSDAFKDLISEISEYNPEFMKDFDFGGGRRDVLKVEDISKPLPVSCSNHSNNLMSQQVQQSSQQGLTLSKPELSPAAQTLKNMAEQHQHKAQMGICFNPRLSQKPYSYPQPDMSGYNKVPTPNLYLTDNIKQEAFPNQGSPSPYSPTMKSPPQRLPSPQATHLQQVFKQQMPYQNFNLPQYRQQNLAKVEYPKTSLPQVLSFQPQNMSTSILPSPQSHYLPRGYLPPVQRSYSVPKAPRHIQPQENWILHQPSQIQGLPQPPQMVQTQVGGRVHQGMSLSGFPRQVSTSVATTLPFSYVNTFPNFVHQPVAFSQSTSSIAPEFNLDFLEHLPHTGDSGNFSDQELFSSLDSGATFNFQDIL